MAALWMNVSWTSPTSNSWTNEQRVLYICEALEKDCSALIEAEHYPQIVLTDINSLGLYMVQTPDVIFVNQALVGYEDGPRVIEQAIIHELVHYLDYHYGWSDFSSCATEALAFQVMNKWAAENGGFVQEDWRSTYGCS